MTKLQTWEHTPTIAKAQKKHILFKGRSQPEKVPAIQFYLTFWRGRNNGGRQKRVLRRKDEQSTEGFSAARLFCLIPQRQIRVITFLSDL